MATRQAGIVITGAGSGLGRAMALRFAAGGYRVAVTDVEQQRINDVLAEVRAQGSDGFGQLLDVRQDSGWDALYQRVLTEWGSLDVLINNAGVAAGGKLEDSPLEDWSWVMDINLMGVVRGCHRFLPLFRDQGRGHIVNVASVAGLLPAPALSAYGTSKSAVVALSEHLRVDLHGSGIGVSVLCPAFVNTNLLDQFRSTDPRARKQAEKWMTRTSVTPADVAGKVFHAVRRNRFMILTHGFTRWAWLYKRWFPGLLLRTMSAAVERLEKRTGG